MIRLPKPQLSSVDAIIKQCSSNYRNADLRKRFNESASSISAYSEQSESCMEQSEYHHVVATVSNVVVSEDEMRDLYSKKFAKQGQPGREFYDALLTFASSDLCAYCGVDHARTLDHYYPKAHYPFLSVTPSNLVPACFACNQKKSDMQVETNAPRIPHPYFDECLTDEFLTAQVEIDGKYPKAKYYIEMQIGKGAEACANARYHFEEFELSSLYSMQAGDELVSIQGSYKGLPCLSESQILSWFEVQYAELKKRSGPAWKTALYKNLASNSKYTCWLLASTS